jgi:hypothetical protein
VTLAGAVLLVTTGLAAAGTDFETFDRQIARSAVAETAVGRPKATCVCQDGSSLHGLAGLLVRASVPANIDGEFFGAVFVFCAVPGFDPAQQIGDHGSCTTFAVLPR